LFHVEGYSLLAYDARDFLVCRHLTGVEDVVVGTCGEIFLELGEGGTH
jgi:hypothetical protein